MFPNCVWSQASMATSMPRSHPDEVLKAQPALGAIEHPECYDVRSSYFRARGLVTLDGLPFEFDSLIERRSGTGGGIRVLQRSRGGDD
jgi:hypothetical protein